MDKASGHHNGVRSRAQHSDVRALYAEAALHKAVWAYTNPRSEHSDRHLAEGRAAENQLIAVPARNQAEIAMKAALLLDWTDQDISPVAKALLQSIIADLEGRAPDPFEEAAKATDPTPAPGPDQKAAAPQTPAETTVTIDRRSRPCVINGVAYPSIMAAAQALGIPYHAVQKLASRKRN